MVKLSWMLVVAWICAACSERPESLGQVTSNLIDRPCLGFCTMGSSCDDECDIFWYGNVHTGTCGEFGVCNNGVPDCWGGGCNGTVSCNARCIIYNEGGDAMNTYCGNFGCCLTGCGDAPPDPRYK